MRYRSFERSSQSSSARVCQASLIKWTGTKRRQAAAIIARFPAEIASYHEPFLGGASVLGRLLDSPIRVGRCECSDSYAPLVGIWDLVKNDPDRLIA